MTFVGFQLERSAQAHHALGLLLESDVRDSGATISSSAQHSLSSGEAAARIQAARRGSLGRNESLMQRSARRDASEQQAAARIQAQRRGSLGRDESVRQRRARRDASEQQAAARIQAQRRGSLGRSEFMARREEHSFPHSPYHTDREPIDEVWAPVVTADEEPDGALAELSATASRIVAQLDESEAEALSAGLVALPSDVQNSHLDASASLDLIGKDLSHQLRPLLERLSHHVGDSDAVAAAAIAAAASDAEAVADELVAALIRWSSRGVTSIDRGLPPSGPLAAPAPDSPARGNGTVKHAAAVDADDATRELSAPAAQAKTGCATPLQPRSGGDESTTQPRGSSPPRPFSPLGWLREHEQLIRQVLGQATSAAAGLSGNGKEEDGASSITEGPAFPTLAALAQLAGEVAASELAVGSRDGRPQGIPSKPPLVKAAPEIVSGLVSAMKPFTRDETTAGDTHRDGSARLQWLGTGAEAAAAEEELLRRQAADSLYVNAEAVAHVDLEWPGSGLGAAAAAEEREGVLHAPPAADDTVTPAEAWLITNREHLAELRRAAAAAGLDGSIGRNEAAATNGRTSTTSAASPTAAGPEVAEARYVLRAGETSGRDDALGSEPRATGLLFAADIESRPTDEEVQAQLRSLGDGVVASVGKVTSRLLPAAHSTAAQAGSMLPTAAPSDRFSALGPMPPPVPPLAPPQPPPLAPPPTVPRVPWNVSETASRLAAMPLPAMPPLAMPPLAVGPPPYFGSAPTSAPVMPRPSFGDATADRATTAAPPATFPAGTSSAGAPGVAETPAVAPLLVNPQLPPMPQLPPLSPPGHSTAASLASTARASSQSFRAAIEDFRQRIAPPQQPAWQPSTATGHALHAALEQSRWQVGLPQGYGRPKASTYDQRVQQLAAGVMASGPPAAHG